MISHNQFQISQLEIFSRFRKSSRKSLSRSRKSFLGSRKSFSGSRKGLLVFGMSKMVSVRFFMAISYFFARCQKDKPSFVIGCTTCCVMCDGTNAIRPIVCGMPKRFFANNKKLTCQSKTMHAIVPYLYWPCWLPISDLLPCPIQVPQLVCVGNTECCGIMLENTPNITSHFSPSSVKSYTPWLFSIWHTFLA